LNDSTSETPAPVDVVLSVTSLHLLLQASCPCDNETA
jgi:hypothetical protein